MKISPEQVGQIAKLARLELDEDKLERFADQFENILNYVDTLEELDTTGVKPLFSPANHGTVLREDKTVKRVQRSDILSNAPESDGQFIVVPKIV